MAAVTIQASNGKSVKLSQTTIDSLVKDLTVEQWPIGMIFEHENGDEYLLTRVKVYGGFRAYLHNTRTGIARNSRKVVMVEEPDGTPDAPQGYVSELPAEKDRFYNPYGDGFIDN